jgi:hypothetical protein
MTDSLPLYDIIVSGLVPVAVGLSIALAGAVVAISVLQKGEMR